MSRYMQAYMSVSLPFLFSLSLSFFRQGNGVEDCSPTPRASAPPTVAGGHGGKRLCWQGPQPSRAKYLVKRDEGGPLPTGSMQASGKKATALWLARKKRSGSSRRARLCVEVGSGGPSYGTASRVAEAEVKTPLEKRRVHPRDAPASKACVRKEERLGRIVLKRHMKG